MNEAANKTIALNVHLKPNESSAHPRATNYTNVGVAQGNPYVDFGSIEPALLAAITKIAKDMARPRQKDWRYACHLRGEGGCAGAIASADAADLGYVRDARQSKPNT